MVVYRSLVPHMEFLMARQKLPQEEQDIRLARARKLYLEYKSVSEIAREVELPRSTLNHHIKRHWDHERKMCKAELFDALVDSKKVDFGKMTQASITVMTRALQDLATRDRSPNVHEAKKACEILDLLDKITRLDDGNPTDIIATEKPATIIEIKEKLALDPFQDEEEEEEIEFKELEHVKED